MKTNATLDQLQDALERMNTNHGYSVYFKRLEQVSANRVAFTLGAESGEPGSRNSCAGRRMPAASWHAHGYFFEELFKINPDAFVDSAPSGRITKEAGNWQDINVGSNMMPIYMSQLSNQ